MPTPIRLISLAARVFARPAAGRPRRARLTLDGFEERITPAHSYTITTTDTSRDYSKLAFDANGNAFNTDSSPVTLYEALMAMHQSDANGTGYLYPGPNVINFNLPGTGVHTFPFVDTSGETQSDDPRWQILQDNTTIDGWSQPGSSPNTANPGDPINAQIRIELPFRIGVRSSNNLIRGLSFRGVDMWDKLTPWGSNQDALNNTIEGNFLGLKADGKTAWGDRQAGVYIGKYKFTSADARNQSNTIGGILPSTANLIAGHAGANPAFGAADGVLITDGSHDNLIVGNYIGTNKDLGKAANALSGVYVTGSAYSNTVQDNLISFNGDYGVRLDGGRFTTQTGNRLSANTMGGIFQAAGANDDVPAPALTGLAGTQITGTLAGASIATPFTVEIFSSTAKDPAGKVEGQKSLGTVTVTTTPFTVDVPGLTGYATVTATDANGNTSVFSNDLKAGVPPGAVKILGVTPKYAHVAAPGEDAWVTVKIENKTGETLKAAGGTALVKVYTGPDKTKLLATYTVPAGKTETLGKTPWTKKLKFQFPAIGDANEIAPGQYTYYVELDPVWKGKTGASVEPFDFVDQFGVVGDRKDVTATIKGSSSIPGTAAAASGTVKLSLKGGGTGTVTVTGGETNVALTGTTMKSVVTAAELGLTGKIHNLSADAPVQKVDMPNVDITGNVSFTAGLGGLVAHDLGESNTESTVTIGKAADKPVPVAIAVHEIRDASISVADGIAFLGAGAWIDTDPSPRDKLTAPFIDQLIVKRAADGSTTGWMRADVILQGPALTNKKFALNKADIDGSVRGTWDLGAGGAKEIKVHDGNEWRVTTTGPVDGLKVAAGWSNTGGPPMLEADTLGTIQVGDVLMGSEIKVTGQDKGSDPAWKELKAGSILLDKVTVTSGGISKIKVADWNFPTVFTAKWVGSLTVQDDAFNATSPTFKAAVTLTGIEDKADRSLGELKVVGGTLGGSLNLFGDADTIETKFTAADWSLVGGEMQDSPGTLIGKLTAFELKGTIRTSAIDELWALTSLDAAVATTLPVPIRNVVAGDVTGSITALGGVTSLQAVKWTGGTLTAFGPVKHLLIVGKTDHGTFNFNSSVASFIAASMTDCAINAAGQNIAAFKLRGSKLDPTPTFTRSSFTVGLVYGLLIKGKADNATFNLGTGAESFVVGSMADCTVNAAGQTIAVFKITGIKGEPTPYFTRTNVTAGTLGVVVLNDVDEGPAAPAYGITADHVGGYSRFVNDKAFEFEVNGKKTHLLVAPLPGVDDHAGNYTLTINP